MESQHGQQAGGQTRGLVRSVEGVYVGWEETPRKRLEASLGKLHLKGKGEPGEGFGAGSDVRSPEIRWWGWGRGGEAGVGGSEVTAGSGPNDCKEKEVSSRGLGRGVRSQSGEMGILSADGSPTCPRMCGRQVRERGWTPEEELSGPGTHPLLTHSCHSCSLRGLLAFAVTAGSVPAWWAALPASCCPLGPRTAAPPVPVSLGIWDRG